MSSFDYFHEKVRSHAKLRPNAIAMLSNGSQITWAQLNESSDELAAAFQSRGIVKQRVATLINNPMQYVIVLLGSLKAQNCLVPLPSMVTKEALARMLADSASSCLIFCETYSELAAGLIDSVTLTTKVAIGCEVKGCEPYENFCNGAHEFVQLPVSPTDECNLLYSSGTTGIPKGILLECQYRANQVAGWKRFGVGVESRVMVTASLYSNWSLSAICATLVIGGTLILAEKVDAKSLVKSCFNYLPTHLVTVPVQLGRMLDSEEFLPSQMPETIKICAGSPFSADEKQKVMGNWPKGDLIDLYGSTEGGARTFLSAQNHPDKLASVGKPYPGMENSIKIIDDDGHEVVCGDYGEIIGFNKVQMREYINQPDTTKKLYWYDADGKAYIRSGDVGRFDADGFLYLGARKKEMIISGGFNVFASDIEAVLLSHPEIMEAAVIGVPSKRWGESPHACVVLDPESDCRTSELISWVNNQLGKPQRIAGLTACDSLPRNTMGKVLKQVLLEAYHTA